MLYGHAERIFVTALHVEGDDQRLVGRSPSVFHTKLGCEQRQLIVVLFHGQRFL